MPVSINKSILSSNVSTIAITASIAAGKSCGNEAIMPCDKATIISSPAVISCGKIVNIASITCGIAPASTVSICGKIATTPFTIAIAPSTTLGNSVSIIGGNIGMSAFASPVIPSTRRGSIVCKRGITFSPTVTILSTKFPMYSSRLAFSSPNAVTRFCHALFIDDTDPCIVVLASFAVVPVIPISVCTMWIASTISAYDDKSNFCPDSFSASARRRCISSFVPP